MKVMVDAAGPADAEQLAAVHAAGMVTAYRDSAGEELLRGPRRPASAELWLRWIARTRATTLVARSGDEVVGFCTLQQAPAGPDGGQIAEIPIIVVAPPHQRRGIGRSLLERAVEEARRADYRRVVLWVLESNRVARGFYAALGFERDGAARIFTERRNFVLYELRYRLQLARTREPRSNDPPSSAHPTLRRGGRRSLA